jgi:hypothetical protein
MGFFFLMTFKIYFDKLEKIKNHELRSSLGFMLGMSQRPGSGNNPRGITEIETNSVIMVMVQNEN